MPERAALSGVVRRICLCALWICGLMRAFSNEQISLDIWDLRTRKGAVDAYKHQQRHSHLNKETIQLYLNATVSDQDPDKTSDPSRSKVWYNVATDVEWNYVECPGKAWECEDPRWMYGTTHASRFNPILAHYRIKWMLDQLQQMGISVQ